MDPRIQYALTDDGTSVAYWDEGEGMPLVFMPALPFSHLQMEWQIPEWQDFYQQLLQEYRVVRYDPRGVGLSGGDFYGETFESHLADLEAVVEHLGLERFALLAVAHAGTVALQYAHVFPHRVSNLLLWCTYDKSTRPPVDRDWESPLLKANFRLYSETIAHSVAGWDAPETARRLAELLRETMTMESVSAMRQVFQGVDTTDILPEIAVPTLVISRRQVGMQVGLADPAIGRRLASRIPGARFASLEGDSIAPFLGDAQSVHSTIRAFLKPGGSAFGHRREAGALRTILFTDLEGHTAMMQRLGDAAGRNVLREHERITREALVAHGGSEVKTMGDGFLASFGSAQRALECATALQRAFAETKLPLEEGGDHEAGQSLRVRIGINAGEPIVEADDLFGNAVIAASRITAQAAGGQILVANVVRELVAGKGFLFSDCGDAELRGFEDPVRVWELSWQAP
jgi:class 3 adenylate cyclase